MLLDILKAAILVGAVRKTGLGALCSVVICSKSV